MHYQQIRVGAVLIEFHNNWLGEEIVMVNGQEVSKKSSIWGTDHPFSLLENGHNVRYILTTKVAQDMKVMIDLRRNGNLIHEDVNVNINYKAGKSTNTFKKKGLELLKAYDLDDALAEFEIALDKTPTDPEIHFHMACAYSVLEKVDKAFESIRLSVENHLMDQEMIFNHDMLAFLRLDDRFQSFADSGFSEYIKTEQ